MTETKAWQNLEEVKVFYLGLCLQINSEKETNWFLIAVV